MKTIYVLLETKCMGYMIQIGIWCHKCNLRVLCFVNGNRVLVSNWSQPRFWTAQFFTVRYYNNLILWAYTYISFGFSHSTGTRSRYYYYYYKVVFGLRLAIAIKVTAVRLQLIPILVWYTVCTLWVPVHPGRSFNFITCIPSIVPRQTHNNAPTRIRLLVYNVTPFSVQFRRIV